MLWGRPLKLIVDHAALRWLHTMKDTIEGGPASRLMRWILKLQEYQFEVEHKAGKDHTDADGVSRLVATTRPAPVESPSSSDAARLVCALARTATPSAPATPSSPPRPTRMYVNSQGQASLSRLLLVLDSTLYDAQPLVYTWLTTNGLIDAPGATRTSADECDADALLLACQHNLVLPAPLLRRIAESVTPTASPLRFPWNSFATTTPAAYVVVASRAEIYHITLDKVSTQRLPGLRPLSVLGQCPNIALLTSVEQQVVACSTSETLLDGTRRAFLDWSVSPGLEFL
jgi:hypothetical protein